AQKLLSVCLLKILAHENVLHEKLNKITSREAHHQSMLAGLYLLFSMIEELALRFIFSLLFMCDENVKIACEIFAEEVRAKNKSGSHLNKLGYNNDVVGTLTRSCIVIQQHLVSLCKDHFIATQVFTKNSEREIATLLCIYHFRLDLLNQKHVKIDSSPTGRVKMQDEALHLLKASNISFLFTFFDNMLEFLEYKYYFMVAAQNSTAMLNLLWNFLSYKCFLDYFFVRVSRIRNPIFVDQNKITFDNLIFPKGFHFSKQAVASDIFCDLFIFALVDDRKKKSLDLSTPVGVCMQKGGFGYAMNFVSPYKYAR
ncbi:hypothetical protein ACJX0J_030621, partial [Zea mays]